ncbi:hypothetical protein IAG44_03315 [Streptomyces roseirectus]|uniref:Uncharacterized protein n=1 Tax=Streptomyces roseirectus TaxID=2768066 RepID=A0A7H0I730_9ACTN|nr:hypothetical protein [Streptomyces roseirectus]QNP68596.1 hypothetical protein IAG44_03315 [Streptomyces roseirectus]
MQRDERKTQTRAPRWEGVLLSIAATIAVLAVIRPDLYGGLVEGIAATVTGTH